MSNFICNTTFIYRDRVSYDFTSKYTLRIVDHLHVGVCVFKEFYNIVIGCLAKQNIGWLALSVCRHIKTVLVMSDVTQEFKAGLMKVLCCKSGLQLCSVLKTMVFNFL